MNGYEDIGKCTSMQRLVACNNYISDIPPHRWNKGTSTTGLRYAKQTERKNHGYIAGKSN